MEISLWLYSSHLEWSYGATTEIDDLFVFFAVIEYLDESHNLIGREFLKIARDHPDSDIEGMQISYYRTIDEYEAWLNGTEQTYE